MKLMQERMYLLVLLRKGGVSGGHTYQEHGRHDEKAKNNDDKEAADNIVAERDTYLLPAATVLDQKEESDGHYIECGNDQQAHAVLLYLPLPCDGQKRESNNRKWNENLEEQHKRHGEGAKDSEKSVAAANLKRADASNVASPKECHEEKYTLSWG